MEEDIDGLVQGGDNPKENQDKDRAPMKLIPEGFVVDDALPSISLEDFEEDDEVWLIDIPKNVDPQTLFGQQLDFRQNTSFIIDEHANERCISMPSSEPCGAICLISSRLENSKKIVSLNPAGKISININYEVPEFGGMIPESKSVRLPEGLKVRHPFLGPRYQDIVKSMKGIKEKIVDIKDDILPIKHAAKYVKNLPANEYVSSHLDTVEEGEVLNVISVKNEVHSPKKSKKRKRESLYEDGNNEGVDNLGDDSCHLSKKHKKEKEYGANFQGFPENEIPNNKMEIPAEECVSGKKNRKDKKRASEIIRSEVNAATFPEVVDDGPSTSSQTLKKKIKKEKKGPHWSVEGEEVTDVAQVESPKKMKKKKRDFEGVSEAGKSGVLPEDITMVGDVPGRTLERVKEGIYELVEEKYDRDLDISYKEGGSIQEVAPREPRIKKEKSKKRHTIDIVNLEAANLDSNVVQLIGMNEFAEKEPPTEGIEVLLESGDHMKKKKKDKKRASEIMNVGLDMETMKEEVIIPDTPERTPNKKKKKFKEGTAFSVKEEEVVDVSLVEPSIPCEVGEHTPKKIKKKKKRDSEYGIGPGQRDVLSNIMVVEDIPDQTVERVKKIKREIKNEMGNTVLEASSEREVNADSRKLKKKLSMNRTDIETAIVDSQDLSVMAESEGTDGMETFIEGLEVIAEESGHVKKRRKKDKKRDSEIVSIGLDLDGFAEEVNIVPGTPGQTPKKKKKVKEETDYSVKEEGVADVTLVNPSVLYEVGEETPKKAKKKKKRDSEHGIGSGPDISLSEEVIKVEKTSEQKSEVVGKSKKDKWYIDRNASIWEPCNNDINSPTGKKMKKSFGRTDLDILHEEESSGVTNNSNNDLKKWKRRHTMDNAGIKAVSTDPNQVHLLSEVTMEGKSQHKKRQSLMAQGFGAQLSSPKKEKKIKKESIGYAS